MYYFRFYSKIQAAKYPIDFSLVKESMKIGISDSVSSVTGTLRHATVKYDR